MPFDQNTVLGFNSLHIGYPSRDLITEGIGSIRSGELISLVGRNGSGKSTLLRVLSGLEDPVEGNILLNGKPLGGYALQERARSISFVSTGLVTENLTVYEMVALGRYPHTGWWGKLSPSDHQKILEALSLVYLRDFASRRINKLSDGERQRVMIARALAQDGQLIILDEPTAFLDLPNKFEVIHLLYQLSRKNKSIIYSTHDIEAAWTYSDKLWIIHEGGLHEGSPEDIGISGLYNELFKSFQVKLDTRSMRFKPEKKAYDNIGLQGEDKELYRWTKLALSRAGYNISTEDSPERSVICLSDNEKCYWILDSVAGSEKFGSLYDLVRYLTGKE